LFAPVLRDVDHSRCVADFQAVLAQFVDVKTQLAQQISFTTQLLAEKESNRVKAQLHQAQLNVKHLSDQLLETDRDRARVVADNQHLTEMVKNFQTVIASMEDAHFTMHSTYKAVIADSEARMDQLSQEVVTLKDTIRQLTLAQSFAKAGAGSSASSVTSPSPASSTPGRRQRSSSINATAVPFVRGGVEVAPTAVGGIIIRKLANPVPKT